MTSFSHAYARLNVAQKSAVDRIDGPVMVVAGPGTGKTQVIAVRVANILKKTQMNPSNILCLTYSTSGAKAMRERLRTIIGPAAYGVTVSTVHGFCNELIQRHPEVFEDFRALEQVSAIEQLRTVRRAFDALGPGSILGKSFAGTDRAGDVLKRITELKRDGIAPEALDALVPVYAEEITRTPTGKERDLTTKAYKEDVRRVEQFEEFIRVYRSYNKELIDSHRYDYEDMVLFALRGLTENDWLLSALQERYQYVLVDEFQDLNGAQNAVIHKIIDYLYSQDAPNIFVVGDDDQAIYRFQGANIANMKSFLGRFADSAIITLTENYRSTQRILDASAQVIDRNEERLSKTVEGVDKRLRAAIGGEGEMPLLLRYPDENIQYAAVADMLRLRHEQGTPWTEIAVICRRNQDVLDIADVFAIAGIPCEVVAKRDLVTHSKVLEAIAVLRAVLSPDTSALLSSALAVPSFGCAPWELGTVWIDCRNHNRTQGDAGISLSEYLLRRRDQCPSSVVAAHETLLGLHQQQRSITLPELVRDALLATGLLPVADGRPADPRDIAGIHAFYEYVKSRCYEYKALTLFELLADIDQFIHEPQLKLQYDMPHLVPDGVQLMTAHGAKGLEFETVVILNAWRGNWGDRRARVNVSLPDHLICGLDKANEKTAEQEDERRLFYVAMTRAKRELIVTFPETHRTGDSMAENQVSVFLAEAEDRIEEKKIPASQLPEPIETLRRAEVNIDEAFRSFLLRRLETFELSVTALTAFLEDPQEFLWDHLLQRPRAKEAHMAYGSAVHHALEQRNLAWRNGEDCPNEAVIRSFETYLSEREVMTEKEREEHLHLGRKVLKRYLEIEADKPIIFRAEHKLSAQLDDIPLTGKVDRIDLFEHDGRTCRVIDYKTGNPRKTEDAVRKDEAYFRQLVFYKILCDLDPKFMHDAVSFRFDFLGNDREDPRIVEIAITAQEVDELKNIIRKVWQKITNLDFTAL